MQLRKHMEMVDEWAGSDNIKKKLFGKTADKYQYQPCIKIPQPVNNDDDDEDDDDEDDD